jgi:hypothetical protein
MVDTSNRKLGINDLRHIYLTQTIVVATITREERKQNRMVNDAVARKFGVCAYWSTDIRELNWIIYTDGSSTHYMEACSRIKRAVQTAWTDIFRPLSHALLEDAHPQRVPPRSWMRLLPVSFIRCLRQH